MFSFFIKRKSVKALSSIVADRLEIEYQEEDYLAKFHATEVNDWHDFEENGHDYKDFSVGLFIISALKLFKNISANENAVSVINQNESEKIFLECICFICCSISKLDDVNYLDDLYGRSGSFYKLSGSNVVLDKVIDLYADIDELSEIDPQNIVDFWEDRIQYYYQLNKNTTENFFKALCYLFSLAIRSYSDMPKNSVLEIDLQDTDLLTPPSSFAGLSIQSEAEHCLYELITIAKRTMYGYRKEDFK